MASSHPRSLPFYLVSDRMDVGFLGSTNISSRLRGLSMTRICVNAGRMLLPPRRARAMNHAFPRHQLLRVALSRCGFCTAVPLPIQRLLPFPLFRTRRAAFKHRLYCWWFHPFWVWFGFIILLGLVGRLRVCFAARRVSVRASLPSPFSCSPYYAFAGASTSCCCGRRDVWLTGAWRRFAFLPTTCNLRI